MKEEEAESYCLHGLFSKHLRGIWLATARNRVLGWMSLWFDPVGLFLYSSNISALAVSEGKPRKLRNIICPVICSHFLAFGHQGRKF